MKVLENVYYNNEPKKVSVYPSSVYVCESCEAVKIPVKLKQQDVLAGQKEVVKYKCKMSVYTIPEYIDKLQQENEALDAQTTELQLALCEVYEMML